MIVDLELRAPALASIQKRDELVVRMQSVLRYTQSPRQAIDEGKAALLARVGFTLPAPPNRVGNQFAKKREAIRREAACHSLLEQWALCQRELQGVTHELQVHLAAYKSKSGRPLSLDGVTEYHITSYSALKQGLNLSEFSR